MILLIDNYDSFSYNLYQLIGSIRDDIKVIRNDELTVKEIEALNPEYIFISPGPGRPEDAGVCVEAIKYFAGKIPIMGICLGHQAITLAFGGVVTYAKELMHGKTSEITICEAGKTQPEIPGDIREIHPSDRGLGTVDVYRGLPEKITVARYHSLAADRDSLPEELVVTAVTEDGEVMSLRHRDYKVVGLQYHPESVLTPRGRELIMNFLTD
ncbi:MAG: aminodeoxychorismate/anthranilate synthase component II [Lachnospiraceae bacterium]|nr:aminodeoxychorismate/anthranilate synthase component II [Lachnospiraceae bacterium]